MEKMERIKVRNFMTLQKFADEKKYRVVFDEAGAEAGIEVEGILTTFSLTNENGFNFQSTSYDEGVDNYFIANSLNVPCCLFHSDDSVQNSAGVVKELVKEDGGIRVTVSIPKFAYFYNWIKNAIDFGILQGFSNCGSVEEGRVDENNNLVISKFALLHVALVSTPADITARFKVENTTFTGFNSAQKESENAEIQEVEDIYKIV